MGPIPKVIGGFSLAYSPKDTYEQDLTGLTQEVGLDERVSENGFVTVEFNGERYLELEVPYKYQIRLKVGASGWLCLHTDKHYGGISVECDAVITGTSIRCMPDPTLIYKLSILSD